MINDLLTQINGILWGYILIAALIGCGLWFTWKTKGVQFRMVGEMFRLLTDSATTDASRMNDKGEKRKYISSFQAFAVSVATRVGTGNLAGVATAITLGGPGAIFWMWVIALLGSATAFIESTLAQLFKQPQKDSFILFAVFITINFGLSNNSIQSNTICSAMQEAFGWNPILVGLVIAALALSIVFGGIHRIARISSVLVPLMAIGYFILSMVIVIMNIQLIPQVMKVIFTSAFGLEQGISGAIGATIMSGVKRGLFSNEAGEGSAPNVAATATTSHPVKQGLIQALGVFTDTLLVCSCTAFIILISGLYNTSGLDGIQLSQAALTAEIGPFGKYFIALAILGLYSLTQTSIASTGYSLAVWSSSSAPWPVWRWCGMWGISAWVFRRHATLPPSSS